MKKFLSLVTLALLSIGSAWANYSSSTEGKTTTLTWDFAEYTTTVKLGIGATKTYEGLTFYGGGGSNNEEVSTGGFKYQGTTQQWDNVWGRYIVYTPDKNGILTVTAKGNGKSAGRRVFVTSVLQKPSSEPTIASGTILGVTADLGDGSSSVTANVEVSLSAGTTYYIEGFGGVTVKKIVFTYTDSGNAPTIGTQPVSATYTKGDVATALSVAATAYNGGSLSYQWYSNTTNSKEGAAAIDGEIGTTYTPSTATAGTMYYFCQVTEAGNDDVATTAIATITVNNPICAAPSVKVKAYNYAEGGYTITATCDTEGATLSYKVGSGAATACTSGVAFYAKSGSLVVTASKEGYESTSSAAISLNDAPSLTSPEKLIPFNTGADSWDKDAEHAYKSVSINKNYLAGIDSDHLTEGLKFRCNKTLKLDGVNDVNAFHLDVIADYVVTEVKFTNLISNRAGIINVPAMYVDGVAVAGFESFDIPASGNPAISKTYSGLNATSQIAWQLAPGTYGSSSTVDQFRATIEVTYKRATVNAAVNSTYGWATFCSDKALDFTGITDVKAYVVTNHSDKAIIKTQVTGAVKANTPLLLEGATTEIPVATTTGTDYSGTNKLVAGDGTAVDAGTNVTRYVLGVNSSDQAEFQKIVSTPATVPAGKAYLEFNETIDAPFLSFDFSDMETTGINAVSKAQVENGEVYNLNGQRVSKPAKGLYIVNGKKVVIK